ncbi:hypothetical protein BT93_F0689 [Corymbia citriodora subsp. variegata]|nr:hypothetical protein BT93_F0689 [Corymbia citriodora subsp. variegata]
MTKVGIRIFRDDEELPQGERISEILRAVENSQLCIPIFSKNYAWSTWCLRELTRMVESCDQSLEKRILPIFYDVDPEDVELETELYQSALTKHEEVLGCPEVKPWKDALTRVAGIKGWHIKDGRQGEVIDEIIGKVSQMIRIRKRHLPTYLIGIDDRVEDIKKLLNYYDTCDVRFVVIHGIGGMGKTTLAKAVFDQLSSQFEGYSFLSNILESCPCCGIEKMQRKLIADLFGFLVDETFDMDEGNDIIRKRLPYKRVVIVFDGMDKEDQFMQLAKHCKLCCPGSRIIITTRDKSIFPMTKAEGLEKNISTESIKIFLYEMKEMHFDHTLQLFNKHAFGTDSAPKDLSDLSREVVSCTGGLPWAVEVMGSLLRSPSRGTLISTLEKLKEVPHEKVIQKLRISYDALGCEAKQIFLDIACFFINKKKTNAMYLWEDCKLFPKFEIKALINKSLIKMVDHDRIWMYDQLRNLGREIVRQENTKNPGDRSRLWSAEMALDIVRAKKGTGNVVAITLALQRPEQEHHFTREHFANFVNTRFLELDGGNFAGNFKDILPELRWLSWQHCPPKLQANNFVLNHLVVLKLSGDISKEGWSSWVQIMGKSKLKVFKITGSKSIIRTPSFSKFMSLERLVLKNFLSLAEIDSSISKLKQLIYLKIKGCPSLRELPKEIGSLTALRELILTQCYKVCDLPDSIGNLSLLSRLVMDDTGLVELPRSIEGLVHLERLSLVNCSQLNLLHGLENLNLLTELDLSGTTRVSLPHSIQNRENLKKNGHAINM